MNNSDLNEFLVLSRGQWDASADKVEIEAAIGKFYEWIEAHAAAGRMKHGSRLATGGARITRDGFHTDGPFGEAKEAIGGYWFILARDLDEAARIASGNPCLPFGLCFEIRPLESARASVYNVTNETCVC